MDLRANTPVDILIGPFVDETNGKDAETALSLARADIRFSKNGQNMVEKNDITTAVHDEIGYYNCELDAVDTNTEGLLVVAIHKTGALPVRHEYNVMAEAAWDSLYVAKDTGFMDVNIKAISEDETAPDNLEADYDGTGYDKSNSTIGTTTVNTDMAGTNNAALASVCTAARLGELDAANLPADIADIPTVSEFNARTILSADYVVTTDTIAGATLVATVTDLTNAPTVGDLTAAMKASVNVEADAALSDIHLDHLLAVDYDPSNQPGIGTALLNELIENDVGVSRFTANALEQAPTGGSAPTVGEIADAVWDEDQVDHTGVGTFGIIASEIADILVDTADLQGNQGNWLTITGHATEAKQDAIDTVVDLILVDTGTTLPAEHAALPTAIENRQEMDSSSTRLSDIDSDTGFILADTADLQGNQGNWLTITGHATEAKQDAIDAVVDLILIDTGTTLPAEHAALPTAAEVADAVWNENQVDHVGVGTFGIIASEIADILVDTANLQGNQGNWLTITGHATEAKQDIIDANVDLVLADTADLQGNQGNWLTITGHATEAKQDIIDANVDLILTDTDTTLPALIADLQTDLDTLTDVSGEPGDIAPPVSAALVDKIGYLYKFMRNKIETTSTRIHVYNDAGGNKDHSSVISDDTSIFSRGEFGAGD